MGAGKRNSIREQRIKELAERIREQDFLQKYSYGIIMLKTLIERYGRECETKLGRNPVEAVLHRMKSAESIADKLEKKGYEISYINAVQQLSDLAGIRVVCASREDVYRVEQFLCSREDIEILRRKDYIKNPKASGYQSVHLIAELETLGGEKLRVEIQIRTAAMHSWAEEDHKLCYKSEKNKQGTQIIFASP